MAVADIAAVRDSLFVCLLYHAALLLFYHYSPLEEFYICSYAFSWCIDRERSKVSQTCWGLIMIHDCEYVFVLFCFVPIVLLTDLTAIQYPFTNTFFQMELRSVRSPTCIARFDVYRKNDWRGLKQTNKKIKEDIIEWINRT